MANPVSPSLPSNPAPARPEDQYPPLLRAMFDALNTFLKEKGNPLPPFLRWDDEQSKRATCVHAPSSEPMFTCSFSLNSLQCNCTCIWDNGTVIFASTTYHMSDDFLERSKIYLDFLNRSGLKPAVIIEPTMDALQCSWEFTSPQEMENVLSVFEDLFEPARWPEELAEAYLRGDNELPLHCSKLDVTKKVQEIILTLDVFAKLIERNQDMPDLEKRPYYCSTSKDLQVQFRIGALYRALIAQGKGFQDACRSAIYLIRGEEIEGKCEGVKIFISLAEKGFFTPNCLDEIALVFRSDKILELEVQELIDQVLSHGHEQQVLDRTLELFRATHEPKRRFALFLFGILFTKGIGFEKAKELVFPLFPPPPIRPPGMLSSAYRSLISDDRPRTIDAQNLNLLLLLIAHEQCFVEAMENARSLIRSRHNFEAEYGLTIYKALISLEKGFEQAEEDAFLRFQSTNVIDKKISLRLLECLAKKGKACGIATRCAVEAFKSSAFDLRMFGINLLQVLVANGHAFEEATECAAIAVNRSKTKETFELQKEMLKAGFELLKLLVDKGEAIEIAKKWAADSTDLSIKEKEMWQLNLYAALVKQKHAYREATKAAVAGTHGVRDVTVRCKSLAILKELVRLGESIPEALEVLKLGWTSDKDIDNAYTGLYRTLNIALHQ